MVYRQAKAKRIQHHQTGLTRNIKGTFLSEKGKARTGNMKIMKGKISLVKVNIH